ADTRRLRSAVAGFAVAAVEQDPARGRAGALPRQLRLRNVRDDDGAAGFPSPGGEDGGRTGARRPRQPPWTDRGDRGRPGAAHHRAGQRRLPGAPGRPSAGTRRRPGALLVAAARSRTRGPRAPAAGPGGLAGHRALTDTADVARPTADLRQRPALPAAGPARPGDGPTARLC